MYCIEITNVRYQGLNVAKGPTMCRATLDQSHGMMLCEIMSKFFDVLTHKCPPQISSLLQPHRRWNVQGSVCNPRLYAKRS